MKASCGSILTLLTCFLRRIVYLPSGIFNVIQIPLARLAVEHYQGNFFVPNLIFLLLLLPCIVAAFGLGRAIRRETQAQKQQQQQQQQQLLRASFGGGLLLPAATQAVAVFPSNATANDEESNDGRDGPDAIPNDA